MYNDYGGVVFGMDEGQRIADALGKLLVGLNWRSDKLCFAYVNTVVDFITSDS